jgi:hypothetical protein
MSWAGHLHVKRQMHELANRLLAARRKGWVRARPVFEPYAAASAADLSRIEGRLGTELPAELKAWLLVVGFGDIDDALSFRDEWFQAIDEGQLRGGFRFAEDELGNFLGSPCAESTVVFISRSQPGYVVLAPTFEAFLQELERRDYKVMDWVQSVELAPYALTAA